MSACHGAARAPIRTLLVITRGDYERMSNDHDRIARYAPPGGELVVMYKTMATSPRPLDMLRDTVTCRVRRRTENGVRFLALDPFFNYFHGLRTSAEIAAGDAPARPRIGLKLLRVLTPLSVVREVFYVPTLILTALAAIRGHIDVCVGVGPWGGLAALALRRIGKVSTFVYRDRDYEAGLVPDGLRQRSTLAAERRAIRDADLVISSGDELVELRRRESMREIHDVPPGVQWERFAPARAVPCDGRTLVYVGNLLAWSGVEEVIEALPVIAERIANVRLVVVGSGQTTYERRLRNLVSRLGLGERVQFLGRRPPEDLPAILGGGSVGLACSRPVAFRRYAYPLKVLEYMAAGVPVLGTAGTETARIIERFRCGAAAPFTVAALAEAAVALLRDGARSETLRANGIEASRRLTWHDVIAQEMALIEDTHRIRALSGAQAR